jgi:hypothetical protein
MRAGRIRTCLIQVAHPLKDRNDPCADALSA